MNVSGILNSISTFNMGWEMISSLSSVPAELINLEEKKK